MARTRTTLVDRLVEQTARGKTPDREVTVPSVPPVRADVDSLARAVTAIKQILDVREGSAGSALDEALTLRDLIDAGVVEVTVGNRTYSKPATAGGNASGPSGGGDVIVNPVVPADPRPVLLEPPVPTDLEVHGAVKNIVLRWDLAEYANHSYVEVWRHTADNLALATLVGTSTSNMYVDTTALAGVTYYYWVRAVGYHPDTGAPLTGNFNDTAGTQGALGKVGSENLLPLLIEAQHLADGAVLQQKLADAAVVASKIAQDAVTANAIAAGAVVTSKLLVIPESIIPDPLFRDTAWWTGHIYDSNGWYFEDADPSFGGGIGNLPAQMGVGRAAILFDGIPGGVGATRKHVWSSPIPFSGVDQQLRLRARFYNSSNHWVAVKVRFYDVNDSTLSPDIDVVANAGSGLQTLTTIGTVPANAARFRVIVYNQGGSTFTGIAGVSEVKLDVAASGEMIVDGSVTTNKVAAGAIVAGKLAANAIVAGDGVIANAAIDDAQIANLSAAKVTFGEMSGDRIQANTLNGNRVIANTLQGDRVLVNTLNGDRLIANTVNGDRVTAGTITGDRLTIGARGNGAPSILVNADWTEYAGTNSGMASLPGWSAYNHSHPNLQIGRNFNNGAAWNLGRGGVWMYDEGPPGVSEWGIFQRCSIQPDVTHELHIKGSTHRCGGRIAVNWYQSDGTTFISQSSFNLPNPGNGISGASDYLETMVWASVVSPANAAFADVYLIKSAMNPGNTTSWLFANEFYFAPAPPGASQSNPTPFKAQFAVEISGGGIRADTIDVDRLRSGSIVAGRYLRSSNYVAGASGWNINGDGSAEFRNVTVRGDVQATSVAADIITTDAIAGGAATKFTSASIVAAQDDVPLVPAFDVNLPAINYTADRSDSVFLLVGHLHLVWRVLASDVNARIDGSELELRPILDGVAAADPIWHGIVGHNWNDAVSGPMMDVRTTIPVTLTWARATPGAKTLAFRQIVALRGPTNAVITKRGYAFSATIIEFKRQPPSETLVTTPRVVASPVIV